MGWSATQIDVSHRLPICLCASHEISKQEISKVKEISKGEGLLNRVEQAYLKGWMSFVHKDTDLLLGLVMLKAARLSIPLLSHLCLSEDCVICTCALANTGTLPFCIVTRSQS